MQAPDQGPIGRFGQQLSDYLPALTGGLVVLGLGIVTGWILKRIVVRVLIWLRLDRLGGRYGWRAAFGKGDVRAALYELVGSVAMALAVLVFLENALQIWGLTVLAQQVDQIISYVPNLVLAALIIGLGLVLVNTLAERVEDALEEEDAPHPRLLARILKAALMAIIIALGLWQLNFAREIVLAAFLIGFGAIGVAFAMAVGLGSARAVQGGWDALFKRRKD